MGGQVRCYIKQKKGACLRKEIKVLDEKIIAQKQYYQWITQRIKQLSTYLDKKQYEQLLAQELKLYDGFNWDQPNIDLQSKQVESRCPYQSYGCEAIYALKKDVLDYHCSRLCHLLDDYNQMIILLLGVKPLYRLHMSLKGQMLLKLYHDPFWSIGYYFTEGFKPYEKAEEIVYLFYLTPSKQVLIQKVPLLYRREEEVIKGTCLSSREKKALWIQVMSEKSMLDKGLIEPIFKSIHIVMRYLNQKYRKVYGKIQGIYIDIGTLEDMQRKKLIQYLKPLGYKVVGQMRENQFQEEQLLIYRETTFHKPPLYD